MPQADRIEDRIAAEYAHLSSKLKDAADFVATNPVDVATRSLRSISGSTGLAPATFSRLARALGFESYEDMRELSRQAVGRQFTPFSERVSRLQAEEERAETPFLMRQAAACVDNIGALGAGIDQARLEDAVAHLHEARQKVLFGAFGSTGIVEYFAYLGNYFSPGWQVAGRNGASISTSMASLGKGDALVVITKPPFARRSVMAAEMAQEQGAYVIVISDTHACPALKDADAGFILSTESPQFFSSYSATIVLIETMIGMLVSRAGSGALERIREVEERNRRLEEFWTE
ncbi:MAG: MurR/RpiR family transcriptional regulator [Paracoccaceae bacterium]|nr:MurR/RpiR family transcriptional regulator [Paracoccaceae bacterium]